MSEPLKIFEASFDPESKQFRITIGTSYLPYITYAQKLLDLEVDNKIIEEQMKPKNNIVIPKMGIDL